MSDFRINATHIIASRSRTALVNFRNRVSSEYYDILLGNRKRQGTYLDFDVGIRLCRDYGLPEQEKRLYSLKRTSEEPVLEPSHIETRLPQSDSLGAE